MMIVGASWSTSAAQEGLRDPTNSEETRYRTWTTSLEDHTHFPVLKGDARALSTPGKRAVPFSISSWGPLNGPEDTDTGENKFTSDSAEGRLLATQEWWADRFES